MNRIVYTLMILLLVSACGTKKRYQINSMKGEYIPVTTTHHPDQSLVDFVDSYKVRLDAEMGKVIGYSQQDMTTGRPESMLTNLISDLMKQLDIKHTEGKVVDLGFMNVFGIRAPIQEGKITVGDIFKAFPFDNALIVLQLRGNYLSDIFDSYAKMGGAGVSGNVKLVIKDDKVSEVTVDGKPIDKDKLYTIVTLDYLAEGNDGMDAFVNAEWSAETGVTLRDYMLDYIEGLNAKGEKLTSTLDGRITVVK